MSDTKPTVEELFARVDELKARVVSLDAQLSERRPDRGASKAEIAEYESWKKRAVTAKSHLLRELRAAKARLRSATEGTVTADEIIAGAMQRVHEQLSRPCTGCRSNREGVVCSSQSCQLAYRLRDFDVVSRSVGVHP
jgi:chromosome segregation ATPase